MPFDTLPSIGEDTDPTKLPAFTVETDGSEFVPDLHHIHENIVLLADGRLVAVVKVPSYAYELESMASRNVRRRQINNVVRGIADTNVTQHVHLCRHDRVVPFKRAGKFRNRFIEQLFDKYERTVLDGQLVAAEWYLTIIVQPRSAGNLLEKFAPWSILKWFGVKKPEARVNDGALYQMRSILHSLTAYFGRNGARCLGYRTAPQGYLCSEIAEQRRMILTGKWRPVPLSTVSLGQLIYTDRVVCGTVVNQINTMTGPVYAKTVALRDYPTDFTRTGQFSDIIKAKYKCDDGRDKLFPFVLSQSMKFQSREESGLRLGLRMTRMWNAKSAQVRGTKKMEEVQEEVEAGETVRGYHNFGLTVFTQDDNLETVRRMTGAIETAVINAGATPILEDTGSFGAFWSMYPGADPGLQGRSGSISFKNFTAMASFEGFPTGATDGFWGKPLLRLKTSGGTAYDWISHVGEMGHAVFIGKSGSGKTVLMILLALALEQIMAPEDKVFYFDKDQAAQPAILATGGTYLTLKIGLVSGLNPLQGLDDTPQNRTFLQHWIASLMESDERGRLQDSTVKQLKEAVTLQMMLPPQERSLGTVRAFLGFGKGTDGSRLDRWCRGGTDGWLFDGGPDEITLGRQYNGFDFTELFDHPACAHIALYLMQRIRKFIDGRKITVIGDEIRKYLMTKVFEDIIIDFSLTLRKKNGQLWVAAQEPAHIANGRIGKDLINQALTKWVYPSNEANKADYEAIGFTRAMCKAVTEDMPALPYRSVLLERETGSAIININMPKEMKDEICILSGRSETVKFIPDIMQEIGPDNPEAFVKKFIEQCNAYYAGQKPVEEVLCEELG